MIPKIFHQIWIGDKPLPEEFKQYRDTWLDLHPTWEYKFWNNDNLPPLIHQDLYDEANEIVLKANILRIELLYRYGGVYVDMDFECYKNIEELIKDITIFSCGEEEGVIGNAIIGSVPGHNSLKKIMEGWRESIEANKDFPPTIKAGVVYITKTLDIENDITMFPSKYFFPVPTEVQTPLGLGDYFSEAYGMHHWAASWVNDETIEQWKRWRKENENGGRWFEKR